MRVPKSPRPSEPRRYAYVEDTCWPVNIGPTQAALSRLPDHAEKLHAAAVLSAYAHLTDPRLTQLEAMAALKHARRAVKESLELA